MGIARDMLQAGIIMDEGLKVLELGFTRSSLQQLSISGLRD